VNIIAIFGPKQKCGAADSIGEMHEDTKIYVASCPECQRTGNISQRNSVPLKYNLEIDLFDVWEIDFMGPFKNSHGFEHILVMVDYVSKWVEVMPCRKDSRA
jgi:hypothetical protein